MPEGFGPRHPEQVQPDPQQQGADDHAQDGIETEIAERKGTILHPIPARNGKGDAEVEKLLAKPIQGHQRNGAFAVENHGHQRPHRADVGKSAAAVERTRLGAVEPQPFGQEDGQQAAPNPGAKPQNGQGEQAGVRRGQPPQRKHGGQGDEDEEGHTLHPLPQGNHPLLGKPPLPGVHTPLEQIARHKADKDDSKGEQQPVHAESRCSSKIRQPASREGRKTRRPCAHAVCPRYSVHHILSKPHGGKGREAAGMRRVGVPFLPMVRKGDSGWPHFRQGPRPGRGERTERFGSIPGTYPFERELTI